MNFSPWSYKDQLEKYLPKEAPTVIRVYGLEDNKRIRSNKKQLSIPKYCKRCGGEYLATNGRQLYCTKSSQKENCQKINHAQKSSIRHKNYKIRNA